MAEEMAQQTSQHEPDRSPGGLAGPACRRCCAWVMVGLGGLLLVAGVVLLVFGLAPGRVAWAGMQWLGVAGGVIGLMLLVGSLIVYITASETKHMEKYSMEQVHSENLQVTNRESTAKDNIGRGRPRSIVREPSLKPTGSIVNPAPGGYTSFLFSPNYREEESE